MSYKQLTRFFGFVSAILLIASAILLVYPGPKMSLEFTGGTLIELHLPNGKTKTDLDTAVSSFDPAAYGNTQDAKILKQAISHTNVSKTTTDTYFIRTAPITNEQHVLLLKELESKLGKLEEQQFTTIGPTVGATLKQHAFTALAVASIAIILYIAFAFRKVPRKYSPMRFGIAAVLALLHDLLITSGIFTILSQFTTFQVDTLFMTALLTILGYSVNDTIIIFDRIRHNLIVERSNQDFGTLAASSLKQTLNRTLNTTFCTLITLFALLFFGPESVHWFILTLIFGIIIGTYSSFFVATPLLIYWRKTK